MSCQLCGDICGCSANGGSAASPRWQSDAEPLLIAGKSSSATDQPTTESQVPGPLVDAVDALDAVEAGETHAVDSAVWRQEVAARLNRYQARRKPRPPRYPSLRLRFENEDATRSGSSVSNQFSVFPQTSNALALNEFAGSTDLASEISIPERAAPAVAPWLQHTEDGTHTADLSHTRPSTALSPVQSTAKIIEFPRSWTPPLPPVDQLAEPVMSRPRILEAPEVVPPLPALGGITIEPVQKAELEKRPGIDIPLQSAPLGRRILSAAIDDLIIVAAFVLFGFIFWKMTALIPPRLQMIGATAGLVGLFWAAYQYLLIVYSGTTPGLRLTRLQLSRFDGSATNRRTRRWRVFASFLSAVSLGMGYAWVFLDEDALCWHDRITHTYLAPKNTKSSI